MKKVQFFHSWITACLVAILAVFTACDSEMTNEELLKSEMERMPYKTLVNNQEKAGTIDQAYVYAYIDKEGEVSSLSTRIIESSGDEKTDQEILSGIEHANFLRAVKETVNGKEVIFEVSRTYYYNPELINGKGFVKYDEPPAPIGGFKAIQENVKYPEMAQKAGVEGNVIVQGFINENGDFTKYQVLVGVENSDLDNAAVTALQKTKFKPAVAEGKNVGVWITIPIIFKLENAKEEKPQS